MRDSDFEKYRKTYAFEIPKDVLFDWLEEIGWSTAGEGGTRSLVEFCGTPPDTEDSYFNVNGSDNDMKTSLADAVKKAYFKLKDKQKEERRRQYEELKAEFEEGSP